MIERNGGRVSEFSECFTYQIKPDNSKSNFDAFYRGNIYSGRWIYQSLEEKRLLQKEKYFICMNLHTKSRTLNLAKRKKYTIIEGIRLYDIMTNQKNVILNRQFWLKIEASNALPERSAVSLQNFWNKFSCKTLEQYLVQCIYEKVDFCLSFKEIPN